MIETSPLPTSPQGGSHLSTALAFRMFRMLSETSKNAEQRYKDDVAVIKMIKDIQHRSFPVIATASKAKQGEGDGG
jgi:hypothetical protein